LIGGSCYALVGASGFSRPAPISGSMQLTLSDPEELSAPGVASCSQAPDGFSVYGDEVGQFDGRPINVAIDVRTAEGERGSPNVTIYLLSSSPDQQELGYTSTAASQLVLDPASGPFAGSLSFTDLEPIEPVDPSASPPLGGESISGTITWECQK